MFLNSFQTTAKFYLFTLLTDWDLILTQIKLAIVIFVLWAWVAWGWLYNWSKHVATFYDII
jgi:hypothetical protein